MLFFFFITALLHSTFAFDSTYYAYQKGNDQTFGYDAKRVCKILKHPPYNYVRLENAFDQFDRTAVKRLNAAVQQIIACLNYKGYSYLFYHTTNTTMSVIRGENSTRTFPVRIDNLYYDHLNSALYVLTITDDAILYQLKIETLHSFWNKKEIPTLFDDKALTSPLPPNNITDAFVFNHTLYWLTMEGQVYKQSIGSNKTVHVEADYPDIKFSIIPFPADGIKPSITITANPHIKISGLGTDSIFLPLPSSLNADFVYTTNNIFLYILDIIFFLCLIIVLRILTRNRKFPDAISLSKTKPLHESIQISSQIL